MASYTRNGVGIGRFQAKSHFTYFQTPTHQISLLTSLDTLNGIFFYKTQKQPIRNGTFLASFNCISLFKLVSHDLNDNINYTLTYISLNFIIDYTKQSNKE